MSSTAPSQTTFNAPFKRAELLLLPQYAASNSFVAAGKWTGTKTHILSVDGDDSNGTVPLYCIVVGTISSNRPYLGKHGNFSPKFTEDAQKAKLQFTLSRPDDADFGPDFDRAVVAFQEQQRTISVSSNNLFFLLKEEHNAMRMNFGLFDPRGSDDDIDRDRETRVYSVDSQYVSYWTAAKTHNYCSIMPVFGTNDAPVDPDRFAEKLVGAMCEVTFTFKHITIANRKNPDGNVVEATDVFSALVESVAILRNPPMLARSPYKGRITRRPLHRPQLPSRGEQVNAAAAFVPRPNFGAVLPGISTGPPLVTPAVPGMSSLPAASTTLGEDTAASDDSALFAEALSKPVAAPTGSTTTPRIVPYGEPVDATSVDTRDGIKPRASSSSLSSTLTVDDEDVDGFVGIPASLKRKLEEQDAEH